MRFSMRPWGWFSHPAGARRSNLHGNESAGGRGGAHLGPKMDGGKVMV